jgi:hypothetical protein
MNDEPETTDLAAVHQGSIDQGLVVRTGYEIAG